jgi:hypothetical protein
VRQHGWPKQFSLRSYFLHLPGRLENPVHYDANRLFEGVSILKITLRNPYLAGTRLTRVLDDFAT